MYASNEEEIDDWVYLNDRIYTGATNIFDHRSLSHSFSSSTSNSSNVLNRSSSLSSIPSIRGEHKLNVEQSTLHSSQLNTCDTPQTDYELAIRLPIGSNSSKQLDGVELRDNSHGSVSAVENESKDKQGTELLSESILIVEFNDGTSGVDDSVDIDTELLTTSESSSDHFTHAVSSRRSSTFDRDELHVSTIEMSLMNQQIDPESCIGSDEKSRPTFIPYAFAVLIFIFPFIIGHAVGRCDQPSISKIYDEFNKVNQKLNAISTIPSSSIAEDKLTVMLEKRLQKIEHQHQQWQEQESQRFKLEISKLKLSFIEAQRNLTDLLQQLILENQRLRIRWNQLNDDIHTHVEQEDSVLDNQSCFNGIDCKNSSEAAPNHNWMSKIFKTTVSIAENTSSNLFDLFGRVSNSVSNILGHGQNYVEQSQQILVSFATSIAPSSLPKKIRRSFESFSSSINPRKWFNWPGTHRNQQKKDAIDRSPWRWEYQRRYNDQRPPYQSAYSKQENDFSKCSFAVRQIRALQQWMVKIFRP